jgi:hypothetical protein
MQHHNNIATDLQCLFITRLLIRTITAIAVMPDNVRDLKFFRNIPCVICTGIVREDHFINNIFWNFKISLTQCPARVVGWENHDDLFSVDHGPDKMRVLLFFSIAKVVKKYVTSISTKWGRTVCIFG